MRIWHISDTHCMHDLLHIPNDIDMVIHSGDCSNSRDSHINNNEIRYFIDWFTELPIREKIFVAGNHDVSIERRMVLQSDFLSRDINYLENDFVVINDIKIWGSPYTPSFGRGWAWNMARHKIKSVWDTIPEDTDIIVTHGPPKGILDITTNFDSELEFCGCANLRKAIFKIKPKLCCFGHIHDKEDCKNSGIKLISNLNTVFSNATMISDGADAEKVSDGNVIDI